MKNNIAYLNKYFKRYKNQFFIALIFVILETMGDLIQPTIMSKIIDKGVKEGDLKYVWTLGGLMMLVTAMSAIFTIIRNIVSSRVSQSFGADLREDLYIKIQDFSFDNIDEFQDSSLITRLTNDVNQMQNFAYGSMRVFVKAPVIGIGATIMAFILNAKLALIVLAIIPLVAIIIMINLRISYPIFRKIQESLDKVNEVMKEYLAGIRVVKAFNRFDYERKRFEKVNNALKDISLKGMRLVAVFNPLIALVVNIGIVFVLWFGGLGTYQGEMEVGKIMAFVNYMIQILFSLTMITRLLNIFIRAKTSSDRINEVFQADNTIVEKAEADLFKEVEGIVDFKDVDFRYNPDTKLVLEDINFTIRPGETMALIGSTGSGKTTLINLIPRFYDIEKGQIKIDKINIRDIKINDLRNKIGIVPQRNLLFTGTIRENIKWGYEVGSDEEIKKVAKIAQAHDFIESFKNGYDTQLGQGGVNLSGGQKQRIAIARALIKKPKILILDDSTSALDMITEKNIKEALKEYLRETTTILITQRITSAMDADKILVLDKGKMVGLGSHEDLMKKCQVYREIYRSQIGEEGESHGA